MNTANPARRLRRLTPVLCCALTACATPYLEIDDAVEFEDGRTRLVAFAEKNQGPFYGGVEGVDVQFAVDGEVVATATSDKRGVAKAHAKVPRGAMIVVPLLIWEEDAPR